MAGLTEIGAIVTGGVAVAAVFVLRSNYIKYVAAIADAKAAKQKVADDKSRADFEGRLEELELNPEDRVLQVKSLAAAFDHPSTTAAIKQLYELTKSILVGNIESESVRRFAIEIAEMKRGSLSDLYQLTLSLLASKPNVMAIRVFALEVGRLHCGRSRTDGGVTIYDEQAIQNDIIVRCGPALLTKS